MISLVQASFLPLPPPSDTLNQEMDNDMIDMLNRESNQYGPGMGQDPAKYYQMMAGFFGV